MKQTHESYNVGIYCRLSRDDGHGESSSISSQKLMLTNYVKERNWRIVDYYCDDGFSGVSFNRPEFNRMNDDIDKGKINLVICKDLSRLGRHYILAAQYSEMIFPDKGVRFIAVNDNYDSENENNDIAPFMHILNDTYAKDTSRKIKSAKRTKAKNGQFQGAYPPFGYVKSPDNHNQLVIDEETAPIVQRIFNLYAQGYGTAKIRDILVRDTVLTPAAVIYKRNPEFFANVFDSCKDEKYYDWNSPMVNKILKNQLYIGNLVSMKQLKPSYKSNKRIKSKPDDWIICHGTHEAIVDMDTWEIVQNTIQTKKRKFCDEKQSYGFVNEFAGLVKCVDCGRAMVHRTNTYKGTKKDTFYRYYSCNKSGGFVTKKCTMHLMPYNQLYEIVLQSINTYARLSKQSKAEMAKRLAESGNQQQSYEVIVFKKELKSSEKRLKELERLIAKIYEDYAAEKINDDNYYMLIEKYQGEQTGLKKKVVDLTEALSRNESNKRSTDDFIKLIAKYADTKELSAEILNQLIEKIAVHEKQEIDGEKRQQVDIYWRFVGNINS